VNSAVEIHGTCFADRDAILRLAELRDYEKLVTLPGNYSLVIRTRTATLLVASAFGPPNLFYVYRSGNLFHADRVLDVVRDARIDWTWNWRAVADLTSLEHSVGDETLHADVSKLGPGVVVRCDAQGLSKWRMPWEERTRCSNPSPQGAVDALAEAAVRQAGSDPVVSMSAGFDSRVLLSCLLAAGLKPKLITMGAATSTDALVAAASARKFGLPIETIALDDSDYLDAGDDIVQISGGAKTLQNWHTYLYAKGAALPPSAHLFIGSNGEAARTYYLDKGLAARVLDGFSTPAKQWFWRRKLRPIFTNDELQLLVAPLSQQFAPEQLDARAQRLCSLTPGSLLTGLDIFYTEQRVSNFIANGLALVAAHARPVTPMLDRAWMAQVWHLPRHWKLDCAWHRYAIERLCPALLSFPEEKTGQPMRAKSRPGYWLARGKTGRVPYADYRALLRQPDVMSSMQQHRDELEAIASPELMTTVLQRHAAGVDRLRAASFLVAMLHLTRAIRATCTPARAPAARWQMING
jgi:hypothetical protein